MCIGIPMQVCGIEARHATCDGRGERRRVRTALVGEVTPGEWLLVFLDSAQERLDAVRAREINATLDLLQQALSEASNGGSTLAVEAPFELPSRTPPGALRALTGACADTNAVPTPESDR